MSKFFVSLPYKLVNKEISEIISFYKISPIFWTFCVFIPLNPFYPHKFCLNRFSIMRPICPYAGFPVILCSSKVMADCRITHCTSPHILVGLHTVYIVLCNFLTKKMFAPLLPPEWLVPIVGMIATNNGQTCQNHCFGCGNALLMGLPAHGCGVLLH